MLVTSRQLEDGCLAAPRLPCYESDVPPPPLPPNLQRFLKEPRPAVIAALRSDGSPVTAHCWYEWIDGRLLVSMDADGRRIKNIRRDTRIALSMLGDPWYTHVSLFGHAIEIHDDVGLVDADRLSNRYLGEPYDRREHPGVTVIIEVDGWHTWGDPSAATPRAAGPH